MRKPLLRLVALHSAISVPKKGRLTLGLWSPVDVGRRHGSWQDGSGDRRLSSAQGTAGHPIRAGHLPGLAQTSVDSRDPTLHLPPGSGG